MSEPGTGAVVPALELREVRRRFGVVRAVDGVSLRVAPGERVAVIGPNGAGKTTLFGLISGELRADAGEVLLGGRSMLGLAPERRVALGLGRTFQSARLFAGMSVRENLELAWLAGRRGADRRRGARRGWGPAGADVLAALAEVGLAGRARHLAGELAQGERKRLELAMVLAGRPRVLLLDEPTAGMSRQERRAIMELIAAAAHSRGATVMFSEHDMESVFAHAGRVVAMDSGRTIADGTPRMVGGDERARRAYLGGGGSGQ